MDLKVVNAVGSGDLGIEIDLNQLATDVEEVEFNPDKYPGAYVRLQEVEPLITAYRTGKYIITGSTSEEESYGCRKRFLELLSDGEYSTRQTINGSLCRITYVRESWTRSRT